MKPLVIAQRFSTIAIAAALGVGAYALIRRRSDDRSVRARSQPRNPDGTFRSAHDDTQLEE